MWNAGINTQNPRSACEKTCNEDEMDNVTGCSDEQLLTVKGPKQLIADSQ